MDLTGRSTTPITSDKLNNMSDLGIKLNLDNFRVFWRYIHERHLICKKRAIGLPPPWTDDEVLRQFKFTNVFRDIDPGTRYVIDELIPAYKSSPADLLLNCLIYRLYNRIDTVRVLGAVTIRSFDREKFEARLRVRAKAGPVFTNAFIVSSCNFVCKEGDKIYRTSLLVEKWAQQCTSLAAELLSRKNSEFTLKKLRQLSGIGQFLGYQVAVDLGYWRSDVFDESAVTLAGPGCKSGIKRLFLERGKASWEECVRILCDMQQDGFKSIGVNMTELFSDRPTKRLNLMAMENCLCEISKYLKAFYGEGRPRNRYNGKGCTERGTTSKK
eukprot:5873_1